jgi:hypothetical protein
MFRERGYVLPGMNAAAAAVIAVALLSSGVSRASDFPAPNPADLTMKSLTGYPGASAVILFREQTTNDDMHSIEFYERIKILSEEGKKYANVELHTMHSHSGDSDFYNDESVDDIQGRTVHADGTVIPFTGKPYLKTIEKTKGMKYEAKVFTLPDVEVGSIIEYKYALHYSDNIVENPQWYIQGNLFVKSAHYKWFPTTHNVIDNDGRPINSIAWFPILPEGAKIDHVEIPGGGSFNAPKQVYELKVADVPPITEEDHMPPLKSYSYRVLFSLTAFRTSEEYWKSQGKNWSKHADAFMKQDSVRTAAQEATAGATTPDEKLRKIYAKVMSLENTSYTREREKKEMGKVTSVGDVLTQGRGSSGQLAELFVAMARAAGLKSYLMLVPDRSTEIFIPSWMSFSQFDDTIAIVNVDGKDVYFDPGSRYCAYGHLAWQHTFVGGLRQTDNGTAISQTAGDGYSTNRNTRVANLTMDEHGVITGKVDLSFMGAAALRWRHTALRGDEQSLKDGLRESLEASLPHSLEVKVNDVTNLTNYDQPLKVSFSVNGTIGTVTGKRLVMPVDLFESGSNALFSQEKRETAVDLEYPASVEDALRVTFPKGFEVEALPKGDVYMMEKIARYAITVESNPTSYTTRRSYAMGEMLFPQKDYGDLRAFYSKMQTKDKESVVLKMPPVQTAGVSAAGN